MDVNHATSTGETALTVACEHGHTDIADVLLKDGANLEQEAEGGRTPLMKAARAGQYCMVQYLITQGRLFLCWCCCKQYQADLIVVFV